MTAATRAGVAKNFVIVGWPSNYRTDWLRFELVAGLTTAGVVIPQAMACATIAGLPAEVGLYTALVPMLVYALLGPLRPQSVSVTSTIAVQSATVLASVVPDGDGSLVKPK
jgi:MFS superfamily sulfate permease-like transporter